MDNTHRTVVYPLLGTPQQMFKEENVYVIHEKAEIGKIYSIICPNCHSLFFSKIDNVQNVRLMSVLVLAVKKGFLPQDEHI